MALKCVSMIKFLSISHLMVQLPLQLLCTNVIDSNVIQATWPHLNFYISTEVRLGSESSDHSLIRIQKSELSEIESDWISLNQTLSVLSFYIIIREYLLYCLSWYQDIFLRIVFFVYSQSIYVQNLNIFVTDPSDKNGFKFN